MSETNHTPTPWSVEPHAVYGTAIISKGGAVIAAIRPYENMTNRSEYQSVQCSVKQWSREDAAHIVACVNSHDALVDALRAVISDLEYKERDGWMSGAVHGDAYDKARAVLAGIDVTP